MKRIALSFFAASTLLLAGCFESIQEVTIQEDGSGSYTSTIDMSTLISMAKQMGGGKDLAEKADKPIDSTISMSNMADSMENLSPEERAIVKTGTLHLNMNMDQEKFVTSLNFPFSSVNSIGTLNSLSGKVMTETMKDKMGDGEASEGMPATSSIDDYYLTVYAKGLITRTLNKEKYATAADNEFMKGMKEAGGMGLTMKTTYVINLPRPATKAEGKNVTLSDDKKKVTVKGDIDEFFDTPGNLEFRIEY